MFQDEDLWLPGGPSCKSGIRRIPESYLSLGFQAIVLLIEAVREVSGQCDHLATNLPSDIHQGVRG